MHTNLKGKKGSIGAELTESKYHSVQPQNETWTTFITEPAEDKTMYKVFRLLVQGL